MKDSDIDNLLKEKANQIDDNKYNFKINVDEIKRKADSKRKSKVIKISFASALCACLIFCALFFISKSHELTDENVVLQGNDEVNEINESANSNNILKTIVYSADNAYESDEINVFTVIAKIEEVTSLGIKSGIPVSNIMAKVETTLYNNPGLEPLNGEIIEINIFSCIYKVSELPQEIIEKNNVSEYNKNDLIKIIVDDNMENMAYPEKGKNYIISLALTDNGYNVTNISKYPFYEYDPDTQKVKIGDEWQDIDFNNIVW